MIKSSLTLHPDCIPSLEDALYEIAPNNWSLIVNSDDGRGKIDGFFKSIEEAKEAIGVLEGVWGNEFQDEFTHVVFVEEDWAEAYKAHFKPWSFGTIHWVPEWEKKSFTVPSGHQALYLDPGMAFGTGNHETTRLCLESMIKVCEIKTVKDLMDIGCGSGILSLSAKLLGVDKVRAIDSDPDAIKVSKENANDNSIGGDIEFKVQPLENLGNEVKFDLVVANIQADILIKNSTILIQHTKDKGTLVLSGILAKEINLVEKHFHNQLQEDGISFSSQNSIKGEWSLLQLSF